MLSEAYVTTALASTRVLIVEDSLFMQQLLQAVLRAIGVGKVERVETAAKAMERLSESEFDCAIVDWLLEGEDGLTLTKNIRSRFKGKTQRIPIIACTAYTEKERVLALRDAGVNEILVKPIAASMVFDKLAAALFQPRPFITATTYIGPCRRRRDMPIEFTDRRAPADALML